MSTTRRESVSGLQVRAGAAPVEAPPTEQPEVEPQPQHPDTQPSRKTPFPLPSPADDPLPLEEPDPERRYETCKRSRGLGSLVMPRVPFDAGEL